MVILDIMSTLKNIFYTNIIKVDGINLKSQNIFKTLKKVLRNSCLRN